MKGLKPWNSEGFKVPVLTPCTGPHAQGHRPSRNPQRGRTRDSKQPQWVQMGSKDADTIFPKRSGSGGRGVGGSGERGGGMEVGRCLRLGDRQNRGANVRNREDTNPPDPLSICLSAKCQKSERYKSTGLIAK